MERSYKGYGGRFFGDCFRRHGSGLYWAIMKPGRGWFSKTKLVPITDDALNEKLESLYQECMSRDFKKE